MLIYTGSLWQVDFLSICMSNKQDIKCFLLVQAFFIFVALKIELGMIWVHNTELKVRCQIQMDSLISDHTGQRGQSCTLGDLLILSHIQLRITGIRLY